MTSNENLSNIITRKLVPENRRVAISSAVFGLDYIRFESVVFNMASNLCSSYNGCYWSMFQLSNGGFYLAPSSDKPFHVVCENGFEGQLTADAFGIVVFMYATSHLSFGGDQLAEICASQFHLVRDFAMDHSESAGIFFAVD